MTTAADAEADYLTALTDALTARGSISLTADGLAWLLGAIARPPEVPHDDVVLLWTALAAADIDLARTTWRQAWDAVAPSDRITLICLAAHIKDLDPNNK